MEFTAFMRLACNGTVCDTQSTSIIGTVITINWFFQQDFANCNVALIIEPPIISAVSSFQYRTYWLHFREWRVQFRCTWTPIRGIPVSRRNSEMTLRIDIIHLNTRLHNTRYNGTTSYKELPAALTRYLIHGHTRDALLLDLIHRKAAGERFTRCLWISVIEE